MENANEVVICLKNICKTFPGVKALEDVCFSLKAGEIHVLLGENGSGKSTLIKIISGVCLPDAGEMIYFGTKVKWNNPKQAQLAGIATIHQEISLIPNMSVAENIFLNRQPKKGIFIDFHRIYDETKEVLTKVGLEDIDPKALVGSLSVPEQQLVQIAKSVAEDMRVLILDEPTAALPTKDVTQLFSIIRKLRSQGIAILYISHRLEEIEELADTVTILRNGQLTATKPKSELSIDDIIKMMVGREVRSVVRNNISTDKIALSIEGLTVRNCCQNISFELREGEILGIAGLVGSGRSEIIEAIGGAKRMQSGRIKIAGQTIEKMTPSLALENGIGYVPCERKSDGLALLLSVRDNITLASVSLISRLLGFVSNRSLKKISQEYVEKLQIKVSSIEQKAAGLSGGNQQKVVLAKIISNGSKFLVFNEPTRGIDVGARREIYELLDRLANEGKSIILSSTDLPELLQTCDRVVAMFEGQIVKIFDNSDLSQATLLSTILGQDISDANRREMSNARLGVKDGSVKKGLFANITFSKMPSLLGAPLLIIVLLVFFTIFADNFLSSRNILNFVNQYAVFLILGCAQGFALITKGVDLSIGAMVALSSVVLAAVSGSFNFFLAVIAVLVIAFILGFFNGMVSGGMRAEPFVVTLGMQYVVRGTAMESTNGQPVFGLPDWFGFLANGRVLGIPLMLLIAIAIAVAAQFLLKSTIFGRNLVAVGGNEDGAKTTGVPVNKVRWYGYIVSAMLASVVGIFMAARLFSGQPSIGAKNHVEALAAAVIGGVSVSGGRGDMFGVAMGVMVLALINNGMNMLFVPAYVQMVVLGVMLILSVILDRVRITAAERNM